MRDRFDALDFAQYAVARWRAVAIACAVALALAGLTSILLPRRYTATASLVIDLPAGTDSRSATVISPVYLDSLKTFEHLASSDTLFLNALEHLGIRGRLEGRSLESLKRGILKIDRPVNTRVIDISATLDDPRAAQRLAQYIAEQTVALNRALDERTATDVEKDAEAVLNKARERVAAAEKASRELSANETITALTDEIQNASDLKYRVERDLVEAKNDLAVQPAGSSARAAARARIADLQSQANEFGRTLESKSAMLEPLQRRRNLLDNDLRVQRANLEAAGAKLDDIRTSSAFRSERLDVLDPGTVPERPSYPNTVLNLAVALLLALLSSTVWLATRFGYERTQAVRSEREYSLR